jgi:hypothetical protein
MNQSMEQRYVAHSQKFPLSKGFLYTGEDLSLHRKVILYTNENNEGTWNDAYIHKIRKASCLTHDGFQHILDTAFEESSLLIVLKHRPGKPLIQELNHRIWTFPQVISLVVDLGLSMLDAMEEQITSFSVTAENLWLGEDGRLSVINYWEDGEPQTQGAIGLCSLMIQLFSGSAEIPGFFEALDLHLDRIDLLLATTEQKQALVKLVSRVCQGQASLSSLNFSLRSLQQEHAPNGKDSGTPSASTHEVRTADNLPDADAEDEEKSTFPKKTIVGVSGLIITALLIWMLWPSSQPERQTSVPATTRPLQSTPDKQPNPTTTNPSNDAGKGEEITMPNLIGMSQADAEKQALSFGLHYNYMLEDNPQSIGTVFKQNPDAGTKGTKGGNITFWVGKGS